MRFQDLKSRYIISWQLSLSIGLYIFTVHSKFGGFPARIGESHSHFHGSHSFHGQNSDFRWTVAEQNPDV